VTTSGADHDAALLKAIQTIADELSKLRKAYEAVHPEATRATANPLPAFPEPTPPGRTWPLGQDPHQSAPTMPAGRTWPPGQDPHQSGPTISRP
jgi:hypothetical protein